MFKIKSVDIKGFWEKYSFHIDFNTDVNIFIGRNGTGKTTLINLIHSILTVNTTMMEGINFSEVKIILTSSKKQKTITVSREKTDSFYDFVTYKISSNKFALPIIRRDVDPGIRRMYAKRYQNEYELVKNEMNFIVNISWISVHRELLDRPSQPEYSGKSHQTIRKSPLDMKLEDLIDKFIKYQLLIEAQISTISDQFQKNVIMSMLYNPSIDYFNIKSFYDINISQEQEELIGAFRELGILTRSSKNKIEEHFIALSKIIQRIKNTNPQKGIDLDDFIQIPNINRINYMIELSKKRNDKKHELLKPIYEYTLLLQEFMSDKKISIGNGGDIQISNRNDNKKIPIEKLSSGEKQLLILLTETLLEQGRPYIYIADEPELSLHISWQEKILSSIRALNNNAQLIIATHAPEIAGGYGDKIIAMEDLIH